MKSRYIFGAVSFIVWCMLTWVPGPQELAAGVLAAVFVAWMAGDLFVKRPHLLAHTRRWRHFLIEYMPRFLWECVKANIDVAYRVIHPALPIRPGIVKVKTRLRSDTGITFLANSITLTPGTMSVDVDRDNGVLYVHWINVEDTDVERATEAIVERFEVILEKIFE